MAPLKLVEKMELLELNIAFISSVNVYYNYTFICLPAKTRFPKIQTYDIHVIYFTIFSLKFKYIESWPHVFYQENSRKKNTLFRKCTKGVYGRAKNIFFVEKKNRYKFFFNVNLKNYTDGLLTD